ncbi:hypothetical protein [Wukongibacter sp. M2B1]|uniref:hypothetical protein n=1 Tax=Wukongibacter sp. M2B1 TaxID=3088895 RepID=UPI003D79DAB7
MVAPYSTIFIDSCGKYKNGSDEGGKLFDETVLFILENDIGLGGFAKTELAISVGAVGFKSKNDEIYYKNYSSTGKELDYTCFSGLYVHDVRKGQEERTFIVEGTSFSYPMFEGMLVITQSMFKENIRRTLYQDEMIMFLDDYLMDSGEVGWDKYYGKGLYKIPINKRI